MKNVKLGCKTLGFSYGEVVGVGKGNDEISLEDATALVAEGLATVYDAPTVGGNGKALATAKAEIETLKGELDSAKAEIETLKGELDSAKAQVSMLTAELEGLKNGKDNSAKK